MLAQNGKCVQNEGKVFLKHYKQVCHDNFRFRLEV